MNTRQLSREALGILAIGASFFLLASLFSYDMSDDPARVFPVAEKPLNLGGLTGFVVARALFSAFGVAGAYGAGVLLLLFALASLSLREPSRGLCQATFGALGLVLAIACGERLAVGLELPFFGLIQEDLSGRLAGGAWGTFIVHWVARSFSPLAPLLLVAIGASMGGALVFDYLQDLGSNLDELEPVTRAEDEEASWDLGEIFEAPGLTPALATGLAEPATLPRSQRRGPVKVSPRSSGSAAPPAPRQVEVAARGSDLGTEEKPKGSSEETPIGSAATEAKAPEAVAATKVDEVAAIEEPSANVAPDSSSILGSVGRFFEAAVQAVTAQAQVSEAKAEPPEALKTQEQEIAVAQIFVDAQGPEAAEPACQDEVVSQDDESLVAISLEDLELGLFEGEDEAEFVEPSNSKDLVEDDEEHDELESGELESDEFGADDEEALCEADVDEDTLDPLDDGVEGASDESELLEQLMRPYEPPSMDLLSEPEVEDDSALKAEAEAKAALIEECLAEFRIEAKVEHIERGPNVTLYALSLGKGIKVQRVAALLDNLALVLAAPGAIRLQAPIRGTSWVGLEVPNEKQEMVSFAEIYRQQSWRDEKLALPIFLGKDTAGRPLVADLARLPHLLVAGATGSGKSVCINTMILSLLMTRSPSEVKLILIDPKQVELAPFSEIPHLLAPVVTDMAYAGATLDWAVQKMEERYNLLAKARVRHLREYNKLGKEGLVKRLGLTSVAELEEKRIPWKLPYIVVVVDELNDLMMVAQKEVEASIMRLAQKSRAIGIHVILATQRPSVDVITGVIKSNLPARLAFQVTSKVDSRTILDVMGAEKLLGMGDMLFLAPGRSQPIRAKGAYVSEDELERVLDVICHQRKPNFAADLLALKDAPPPEPKKKGRGRQKDAARDEEEDDFDSNPSEDGVDELFSEAVEVVLNSGRGSVSLLQRKLGIGYARAARMIEEMAERQIVGSDRGSKARKVLVSLADWKTSQAD